MGDGIVAFFGYPLAHEGEAERAIHAGLSVIESLSSLDVPDAGHLAVRIGIATGLVVVSSAEKGAVGETMNLASRLQGVAQPGSIVVSERVQRLAGGVFDYEDLGEQTLKGIARPTHAYRIVGVGEASSRFDAANQGILTPMVGREQKIGLLLERWALAQDGEGQVVLLSGEPGIGKSRILSALRGRLEAQGAQALRFQCSPYYVNSAFWPSIDNFERALKFGRDESPESKLDQLEALVVGHYGRPLSDVRFIASMLSIPFEARYGALPVTPQKHKNETLRSLVDLTEAAARKQPTIMLFEDAHWADPTSLEVLDLLVDRVRSIPLLIVLTHRPEFQSRWSQHGHVIALNLSKLTRAQSRAIVSKLAGGKALPAELVEQILAKTDGVPLFVEELTKSILESGELKDTSDRYEYVGSAQNITIPATLRDSLMARLDRYLPVKEIAQIGAAIGREFSYELICAVAPLTRAQLEDALEHLTTSGLAFRRGTPPEATYIFKHALVQDAAYDSLLKSRRQELHGKIARVIEERFPESKNTEPEVLAHHLTAAGLADAAIPLWRTAGELALKRMALSEAIAHLQRGLAELQKLKNLSERETIELDLRVALGAAWMGLGGWFNPNVPVALDPAWNLAKKHGRRELMAPMIWGLAMHLATTGHLEESLAWVQKFVEPTDVSASEDMWIVLEMTKCVCLFWHGDLLAAKQSVDAVLVIYQVEKHGHIATLTNHDPKTLMTIYRANLLWLLGYPDQALEATRELDRIAYERGHFFDQGFAWTFGGWAYVYCGMPDAFEEFIGKAYRVGVEQSLPFFSRVQVPIHQGYVFFERQKYRETVNASRAGTETWFALGGGIAMPHTLAYWAAAHERLGEVDQGLEIVERGIEQACRPGWLERAHLAELLRVKGTLLELKGEPDAAEITYLSSLDWARAQQAKSLELRTAASYARLMQSQGRDHEALELLNPLYSWFTEGFDTRDLKEAGAVLEQLKS